MQKFRVRKGCIFECGWLPPTLDNWVGYIGIRFAAEPLYAWTSPNRFPVGLGVLAAELVALQE